MIGEDDVRYVAKLARLRLEQDEVARMTGELAKILAHIDKMSELDMADVPPTAHVLDVVNVTRADKPRPSLAARRGAAQRPGGERRLLPRAQDGLTRDARSTRCASRPARPSACSSTARSRPPSWPRSTSTRSPPSRRGCAPTSW